MKTEHADVAIIGAGAAGLFCAAHAARRGRHVIILDHAEKIGEKIRISGGGRCNFTNIHTHPDNFLSQNRKFCVSALSRFTPQDFIQRVDKAGIAWHEKKLGQLFCDDSATQITDMLLDDLKRSGAVLYRGRPVDTIEKTSDGFLIQTPQGDITSPRLVVATGGKSIPKIGASGFGYQIAEQFDVKVIPPRPALVPLTFEGPVKDMAKTLAGVSVEAQVGVKSKNKRPAFREGFLFTHRGLSGPSILQISSYWQEGESLQIDLAPGVDAYETLRVKRSSAGKIAFATALADIAPRRLATSIAETENWQGNLADWSDKALARAADRLHRWEVSPAGSEGWRTAEVTLGGVDTKALNSQTMETKSVPGLYFIGEVVDVTGWLGGYNFQWAWASAHAAAQAV